MIVLAMTFGGEMEIMVTPQIRIVPQFRVSLMQRGSIPGGNQEMAKFGFDRIGTHAAATVRRIF